MFQKFLDRVYPKKPFAEQLRALVEHVLSEDHQAAVGHFEEAGIEDPFKEISEVAIELEQKAFGGGASFRWFGQWTKSLMREEEEHYTFRMNMFSPRNFLQRLAYGMTFNKSSEHLSNSKRIRK